jgi:hypothetical protein
MHAEVLFWGMLAPPHLVTTCDALRGVPEAQNRRGPSDIALEKLLSAVGNTGGA